MHTLINFKIFLAILMEENADKEPLVYPDTRINWRKTGLEDCPSLDSMAGDS